MLGSVFAFLGILLAVVLFRSTDDRGSLEALIAGEPRRPDAVGVIAQIEADGVTLTDGSRFGFHEQPVVVSSYTRQPVSPRPNQFVHLGLIGDRVRWMAVLGVVAKVSPPRVDYTATIDHIDGDELVFDDGTVLPVVRSVTAYPGFAIVEVDPEDGLVRRVQQDVVPTDR